MDDRWDQVDAYLEGVLLQHDEVLDSVLAANAARGLPAHDLSPLQGKFLLLLCRLMGARTALEIGTLGGYSTIWLARGVGEAGRVITLESDPYRADVATSNLERAGVANRTDIVVGAALSTLPMFGQLIGSSVRPGLH